MLAPEWWKELKYQTQYGPEYTDFPYFPAALEFDALARNAIMHLDALREYRTSSLLLYPAYSHLVRRPTSDYQSRPHVTTQRLPSGFVMPLAGRNASAPPKPPCNPCFLPLPAPAEESACSAPLRLRARSLRSDPSRPHDTSPHPLHSSRLALRLRMQNTRFHDTTPPLSSQSLLYDN